MAKKTSGFSFEGARDADFWGPSVDREPSVLFALWSSGLTSVELKSRYSCILLLYLEANKDKRSWCIDVEDLRRLLECNPSGSYETFKVFNDQILKRCQKELLEKTELRFTYTPVKKGRRVERVCFEMEDAMQGGNRPA